MLAGAGLSVVSVAVAGLLCVGVVLSVSTADDDDEDEGLDKETLVGLYKKGVFILESVPLKRCIATDRSNRPVLESCERPTRRSLWAWMSRHRLYNLGAGACLGLNLTDVTQPLGLFECDTPLRTAFWRCSGPSLYGASQMKLAVMGRLVVASRTSYHAWRRWGTPAEGPCSTPYEDVHTLLGNGQGMPCAFPFKYNNRWYWECTSEGREDNHAWCSTTPHSSCDTFWEWNAELGSCYQFNLYTIVTWSQARASCRAQRGDLLSLASLPEHGYIRGVMVWIGLNHLTEGRGWQWSDGAPLALVNFTTSVSASPLQDNRPCGVYNSAGVWQSLTCESALPYICKKTPNRTRRAEPLENWQYLHTMCPDGWTAHNGLCYRVLPVEEAGSWEDSSRACGSLGAHLVSIHSLSQVELLLGLLANVSRTSPQVWIGLRTDTSQAVFWSDGSPVTLTQWAQYQPPQNLSRHGPLCGRADPREANWVLAGCEESLPAVCQKKGKTDSDNLISPGNQDCPEGESRHGNACYLVTEHVHNFEHALSGYFCKDNLLTVDDRFEQAFVNSLLSERGANSSRDYWISLEDFAMRGEYRWVLQNGTTRPLTYSNWNKHQPVSAGGCVVMSGGVALGHWEVKDCKSHKALSVCKHSIPGHRGDELPGTHINGSAPCPAGWESRPGLLHCYKVFHDEKVLMKRSWVEADFFCQALGADLASLHHYEEQAFIKGLISNMFEGTEGRCHLTDGLLPQPCDAKHEWICQLDRGERLETPYWYTEQSDPWVFYRGAEYLLARQLFDWEAVSLACQMMGAQLLSIHSQEELRFIQDRMAKRRTVSVVETPREPHYIGGCPETWLYYGHKVGGGGGDPLCTVLSNHHDLHLTGNWYDQSCAETSYGFICQKPQDPSKPPTHSYLHPIPDPVEYKSRSYRVLPGNMSWYEALQACTEGGAELASITDPYHQAFLTVLVNRLAAPHWIGLYSQDDGVNYQWSDGSDTVYAHWDASEDEQDTVAGEECVYMDVSGGWRRAYCETPLPGALCHVPPPRSNAFSIYEVVCPSSWVKFGNGCYDFEPTIQRLTLEEAREHCRLRVNTSDVLSVRSEAENRFVLEQLWSSGFPHQTLWLGAVFDGDTEALVWLDGSPLNYSNWHYRAPDRSALSADTCLSVRVLDGMWHLCPCTQRLGFVCKTHTIAEVEVEHLNGLHHGVVPAAVLVAVLIFCVAGAVLWLLYRRSASRFGRLPPLVGGAYYRQTDSQATESDGNVLITDLEGPAGE
ncbi:hypothetical protein NHX12_006432 [Muraenolepis orangiensis]|uniref:Secretory phospholipase A2 receptor n=1 Tax=Muraenolepis orangiensis TaxID=630683 RepID=A0A9Q0ID47_9TELE|nr:hypothetical protein NHX12_006432 [Muraenolepis orangiensis]